MNYLKDRAKASLEAPSKKASGRKRKLPVSEEISNPELYNLLKEWRDKKASEFQIQVYRVISLRAMRALTNQVPVNLQELKQAHGIGKKKLEKYGDELLTIIKSYLRENEVKIIPVQESVPVEKTPKMNTKQISFELWQKHKDLEKVAAEREFAVSTVMGHLSHFVGTGELPVTDFVDEEKLKTITTFFKENGEMTLGEAKNQLGDAYSYTDLRFVQQHLVYQASKE